MTDARMMNIVWFAAGRFFLFDYTRPCCPRRFLGKRGDSRLGCHSLHINLATAVFDVVRRPLRRTLAPSPPEKCLYF